MSAGRDKFGLDCEEGDDLFCFLINVMVRFRNTNKLCFFCPI